jgi:hypothetical protein
LWASEFGHKTAVQMLVDVGADVNAQGGQYGNALQAASEGSHEKTLQMLVDMGADVNAQGGCYGNALQAASARGHEKIVQMLVGLGVDVNTQEGQYGNAIYAASENGHEKAVQMLVSLPADVYAQGGRYSSALQAALEKASGNDHRLFLSRVFSGSFYQRLPPVHLPLDFREYMQLEELQKIKDQREKKTCRHFEHRSRRFLKESKTSPDETPTFREGLEYDWLHRPVSGV